MKIFDNLSIKCKLIGIILFVTIATFGIGFTIDIIHDIKTYKNDMVNNTIATAQVIGDYCSGALLFSDHEGAKKILEKLISVPSILNAIVYNSNGEQFASFGKKGNYLMNPPSLKNLHTQFKEDYLHVFQPINYDGEFYGMIYLCSSQKLLHQKIINHLQNMLLLIIILTVISIILALKLQRIISQPILKLANIAKQIAHEENYDLRIQKFRNDETGILYDGFNNMLDRIQDRENKRKKAEDTLKKSNEQLNIFRKFAEASRQGMGIADLNGNITYANSALSKIVDEDHPDDMHGKNVEFYYPEDLHHKLNHEVIKSVLTQEKWIGELPLLSKKNKITPCIQSVFLIYNDNGNPNYIANVITDITERKKAEQELANYKDHLEELVEKRTIEITEAYANLQQEIEERKQIEQALRQSEASLATAQRIAHIGNWDWDIENDELYWSDEIYRIFGLNKNEFGATFEAFMNSVHPDDRLFVKTSVEEALKNKKSYNIDHRILRPDDSELIVHEHAEVFVDDNGKPLRMLGTVQDVTDHKKAEQELKNAQSRLVQTEKMASLGMLVAGVAHEINTPMGAINSMYDTVIRAIDKIKCNLESIQLDDYQKNKRLFKIIDDANKVIVSGTKRVTEIVRRLKSFARLDEAEFEEVDIHDGIEDTLTMVHHELKHKAKVKREFGNIPRITCNPSQLNQVYLNLLVNATQAIKENGEIKIITFQKDNKVYIQFIDNGIGIRKELLKKIFDPGFTTKGVGVGTGLGLSICYQIIQDHNGEILVESEQGIGSTFTIILPVTSKS